MALPESFIRELHDRNDIVSVISAYVQLKQRGRTRVGLCPFHGEKTPSFTVYPDTSSFYCFGCGVGGDVITFTMKIDNLDYIDAVKQLAQRSGLEMPENTDSETANAMRALKLRILEANREAARFYNAMLSQPDGREGIEYLKGARRLADNTIRAFGLGFAPNRRSPLTDHLIEKGFRPSELIEANLTLRDRNGGYFDRFRNRVMFPIIDVRSNVIAFGGRIMTDEKPKYLNTSDTPAYKKTSNLYALNRAKNSKSDCFILCEGYMDVIALYQAGFDNVVGGLGTALTEEQARLISRYRSKAVLCYDSDEAGQKAAVRAMKLFDKHGIDTHVIKVPNGKDPDEFIKLNGENGFLKFKALVDNSLNEVDYVYDMLKQKYNTQTVDGKMQALNEAAHFLSSLSSPMKRDLYAGKISEDMGIKRESMEAVIDADIRAEQKHDEAQQRRYERQTAAAAAQSAQLLPQLKARSRRSAKAEEALIACLIAHPENTAAVSAELSPETLTMPLAARVYSEIVNRHKAGMDTNIGDLTGILSDDENMQLARMIAAQNELNSNGSLKLCMEYINVIKTESKNKTAEELAGQSDDDIMKSLLESKARHKKKA